MDTPKKNVLELAKQGNPKAIAALIDKSLSKHGISVSDIKNVNGLLTIQLKSEVTPINKAVIQKIKEGAKNLDIQSVENVDVIDESLSTEADKQSLISSRNNSNKKSLGKEIKSSSKNLISSKKAIAKRKDEDSIFGFKRILVSKKFSIAGGVSGVGLLSLAAFLSLGSIGSCKLDSQPAYEVFQSFESEWFDAVELAHSTSRMSLPLVVQKTQSGLILRT